MALKVDYVTRELVTNLKRNLTLTVATVVTIAVTIAFFGAWLLINDGVENSNRQFRGNVQFIVFMNPDATPEQVDAMGTTLTDNPNVRSFRYLDHDAAFAEFKELFQDDPEITENVVAADLPTSYKVTLKDANRSLVEALDLELSDDPGVKSVESPVEQVARNEQGFASLRQLSFIAALLIGAAAIVLIFNSIRIAMFARRREIEVMKLVGATNWFIRVPFMAEGLVQGLVGSAAGIGMVFAVKAQLLPDLQDTGGLFSNFTVDNSGMAQAAVVLVIIGAFVGVVGSAFASSRFMDV